MLKHLIKYLVLLIPLVTTPIHGFWWSSTTTEAPPEPVMQQIPLTYFRTYTYQPMAQNPLPFPLMSSTDYISNYAALANNPYFNRMMSIVPPQGLASENEISTLKVGASPYRPSKSYAGINVVRSLNNGYLIPPTTRTTTSTTSTTRKPTTTTSTTTTSTTTTTTTPAPTTTTTPVTTTSVSAESSSGSNESGSDSLGPLLKADSLGDLESNYPAFNRKVYTNHFNINYNRPVYPFPEYSIYKGSSGGSSGQLNKNEDPLAAQSISPTMSTPSNIEFVPCMCPVNIQGGYPSTMPITGNPSNSIFLAQGRTNSDVEAETEIPADSDTATYNSDKGQPELPLLQKRDDLKTFSMEDNEDAVMPSNGVLS